MLINHGILFFPSMLARQELHDAKVCTTWMNGAVMILRPPFNFFSTKAFCLKTIGVSNLEYYLLVPPIEYVANVADVKLSCHDY